MRNLVISVAVLLLSTTAAQAVTISSTFDTGTEGWVSGSLTSGAPSGSNTVTWDSSTQSIISPDPDGDDNGFIAPTKFTGDLSAYAGGTISFQLADSDGNTQYEAPVAFFGTVGTVYAYLPTPPSTNLASLTSYSINLVGANFYTGTSDSPGTAVSDAYLNSVLASVKTLGIGLDFENGADNTRLDNVVLTSAAVVTPPAAVPEPASWAMMIVGFGGIGGALRRRRTALSFA